MRRSGETPAEVERWLSDEISRLMPAGLGSVSLRRTRCMRKHCHACETGEQHASYVLYGRRNGHRRTLYIPDALAERLRKTLENGRKVQDLLFEAGRRYAEALKREYGGKP